MNKQRLTFECVIEFDQDDGTCGEFKTRSECVHDISLFDTSRARCEWMEDQSYCQYKVQKGLSIYVTVATLLLTFGLVIPLKMVLTLFFEGIRAPTSIAKSDASSKIDDLYLL